MSEVRRSHRVDDRIVVPIAAVAGLVAATAGAEPTGNRPADLLLVTLTVGLVTWAGASARWWAITTLAALAAVTAPDAMLFALAGLAFLGGAWIGTRRQDLSVARAVVVGVALDIVIRSDLHGFLGLATILGVGAALIVLLSGVQRRRGAIRRSILIGAAVVGVTGVVAVAGLGVAAASASTEFQDGTGFAREGVALLADGDYAAAGDQFVLAAEAFSSADRSLDSPWAKPATWVPIVAQNRDAAADLGSSAASASAALGRALGLIDPEQFRLVGGRIDIDAIRLAHDPFSEVAAEVATLRAAVDDARSPWLLEPIDTRLDDLDAELASNQPRLDSAVSALELAPQLLGADGPRRYFVAFTTPAETRGLGGFMGNWAVLTARDGRLRFSDFGRTGELNRGGERPRFVTGPADWLDQWGRYGFTDGPDGGTDAVPWSRITISPVFPSMGEVVEELLPQSGGAAVDGVFAMDPEVLSALLAMTGPISIDGADGRLSEANLIEFLLVDQYEIENASRIDLLEEVSQATIGRVLGGALPNPTVVARELGPLAAEGRLVGWALDPEEQALFESVGMAGAMPDLAGGDGIAVVLNNAGENKLDVYLERDLQYAATVDEATGAVEATLQLTLTNTARPDELPEAVVQNSTGDALGTNRTLLSLYSALPLVDVRVGGRPIVMTSAGEAGWIVNSSFLGIEPGGSVVVVARFEGQLEFPDGYTLARRPQPMVIPEVEQIDVSSADGSSLIAHDGVADRPSVLTVDAATE